ncbi:MAG: hypothetical protein MGG11_19770 [Trichodesmium sp. MAG_R03]|nr:hypothetical protein [Trichodesmium sp. MAG_R03]
MGYNFSVTNSDTFFWLSPKNGVGFRELNPTYGIFSLTSKPEYLRVGDRLI